MNLYGNLMSVKSSYTKNEIFIRIKINNVNNNLRIYKVFNN